MTCTLDFDLDTPRPLPHPPPVGGLDKTKYTVSDCSKFSAVIVNSHCSDEVGTTLVRDIYNKVNYKNIMKKCQAGSCLFTTPHYNLTPF